MLQSAACTGGKQSRITVYLLLDPDPMATFYTRILNECNAKQNWFPEEATDCLLSLLPKPGKSSRRPRDLRPLGLQDPCSKVLANVLKAGS